MLCVAIVMYEISEVVRLTYRIFANTEEDAIKMWQDLCGANRPSRALIRMECHEVASGHPSIPNSAYKSGRPKLQVVRPMTEGGNDGPVPSDS